jgi:hypothetical protein
MQFSLAAVFEYTTLCAVLCAFSPVVGIMSSLFLMVMALSLGAKQGLAALIMLMVASISADWQFGLSGDGRGIWRQLMLMLLAALVCYWYLVRRRLVAPLTPFARIPEAPRPDSEFGRIPIRRDDYSSPLPQPPSFSAANSVNRSATIASRAAASRR